MDNVVPYLEVGLEALAYMDRQRFVHPFHGPHVTELSLGRPSSVVEYTFDTTRNITNALYRGAFQRYPDRQLIVAHCRGTLPTLGWRIAEHNTMGIGPEDAPIDPEHVAKVLRGLYYDTALAGSRNSLLPTLEVTGPEHILFGTDRPAAPESAVIHNIDNLTSFGFTEPEFAGIEHGNAARQFNRFR